MRYTQEAEHTRREKARERESMPHTCTEVEGGSESEHIPSTQDATNTEEHTHTHTHTRRERERERARANANNISLVNLASDLKFKMAS